MGYTVQQGHKLSEYCDTQEQVMETLKRLNAGQHPKLLFTAPNGSEHYQMLGDWVISVIPDRPTPPAANGV